MARFTTRLSLMMSACLMASPFPSSGQDAAGSELTVETTKNGSIGMSRMCPRRMRKFTDTTCPMVGRKFFVRQQSAVRRSDFHERSDYPPGPRA